MTKYTLKTNIRECYQLAANITSHFSENRIQSKNIGIDIIIQFILRSSFICRRFESHKLTRTHAQPHSLVWLTGCYAIFVVCYFYFYFRLVCHRFLYCFEWPIIRKAIQRYSRSLKYVYNTGKYKCVCASCCVDDD